MTPVSVRIRNLTVSYGERKVLKGLNFECLTGQFVCIVGRSGSGKSTFLNALAGLIPSSGSVEICSPVGYVFQNHALFPWMSVQKNIAFGLNGLEASRRLSRVAELLAKTGLSDCANCYPSELSGGQVQRVALARALAPDPPLLLMDEPYAALDYHTRERMQTWLLDIWQETAKTVLFVTHSIDEAIFLADRLVVLREGLFLRDMPVPFGRPRQPAMRTDSRFLDLKLEILSHMDQ